MAVSEIYRAGPWCQPVKATGVMCGDGKRRTVRITGEAGTFSTFPAVLKYKGKSITGCICRRGYESDPELDLGFFPNANGKNGHLIGHAEHTCW